VNIEFARIGLLPLEEFMDAYEQLKDHLAVRLFAKYGHQPSLKIVEKIIDDIRKNRKSYYTKRIIYYDNPTGKKPTITVKLPNLEDTDSDTDSNVIHLKVLMQFLCNLLSVGSDDITFIQEDDENASLHKLHFPVALTDSLKAISAHIRGTKTSLFTLNVKGKIKGNILGLTQLIGLIKRASPLCYSKRNNRINRLDLMKEINKYLHLQSPDIDGYSTRFIKEVLNITSTYATLHSGIFKELFRMNKCKSLLAICKRMGYTVQIPNINKLKTICNFQKYMNTNTKSYVLMDYESNCDTNTFRSCVKLTLPLIGSDNLEGKPEEDNFRRFKKDINVNPLKPTSKNSDVFMKKAELAQMQSSYCYGLIDAIRKKRAYASGKQKGKIPHEGSLSNVRDRLNNLCKKLPYQDLNGKTYRKYAEIPLQIRNFLKKLYLYEPPPVIPAEDIVSSLVDKSSEIHCIPRDADGNTLFGRLKKKMFGSNNPNT
jgi:hypothetical protein